MPEEGDIVVTHDALTTVAGWLGISDATKVLEESKDSELENGRRQGLGLGAKYIPHHKEALLSKAEGALTRSLRRANVLKPAPAITKHGMYALVPQNTAKDAGRQQDAGSDADEEEGRGRALGAAPRKAVMTRAELFTSTKAAKRQRQKQRSAS